MLSLFNWLFQNNPELTEYTVSYIAWLNRPLKNSLAASLNGKHSMIDIKFTHNKRKTDKIEMCVERLTNGIYQSDFISRTELFGMVGKVYCAKRTKYSLKHINLHDLLIHCNQQNEIKYAVGSADCHCFAKYIWELCTINSFLPKPNTYLVSVAKATNYKFDYKTKVAVIAPRHLIKIDQIDPRHKENSEILSILSD